jgi:ribosomal protein S18 acetylase RimI-like enzyme
MGVRLRRLREDEFEEWLRRSRDGYARDMVEHGGFPEPEAREKARVDIAALLGDGLQTEGHAVFALEDDSTGERVGNLWLAERRERAPHGLAVFDVHVERGLRGRGYGRAAMLLAEDDARRRGLGRIDLNVFARNAAARSLYRSLGYEERSVYMSKSLS